MRSRLVAMLVLYLSVACCATPAGVPPGAGYGFELKVGSMWHWRRHLQHGCADWTATDSWASVHLSIDPSLCGDDTTGVTYLSAEDALNFRNYWRDPEPFIHVGGNPCPQQITPAQIAEIKGLAEEAEAASMTEAERRMLRRVQQRLATANGATLLTDMFGGCSDLTWDDYHTSHRTEDVWRGVREAD